MRAGSGLKPDGIYESGSTVKEKMSKGITGSSDNCSDNFGVSASYCDRKLKVCI